MSVGRSAVAMTAGGGRGAVADRAFVWACRLAGVSVLAIAAAVVWSTVGHAAPALSRQGWGFLGSATWSPSQGRYGALALIYGTVVTSAIAVAFAVPIGLGVALFTTEVAPRWLRRPIGAVVDLLAAVPSVVFGLVGLLAFHGPLQRVYQSFAGAEASGSSLFTAGLVVAFMITPIVTSVAREVFETVPQSQRDAAFALGSTRWEMVRATVLPSSRSGITGAVMLGLGRALGETVAVSLVVGSAVHVTANVFEPGYTMAAIIANTFNGEGNLENQQALMGLGVVLFVITMVVNMAARAIVNRSSRRSMGTA